jgi:hypothetical protein
MPPTGTHSGRAVHNQPVTPVPGARPRAARTPAAGPTPPCPHAAPHAAHFDRQTFPAPPQPHNPETQNRWPGNHNQCAQLSAVIINANTNTDNPTTRAVMFHLGKHIHQGVPTRSGSTGSTPRSAPALFAHRPSEETCHGQRVNYRCEPLPAGALDGHIGGRHGRGADGRAGIVIDESNTSGLVQASAGTPAHDWLTATGAAISYAIAALGAAITAPTPRTARQWTPRRGCARRRPKTSTSPPSPTTTVPTTWCASSPNASGPGPPPAPPRPTSSIWSPIGFRQTRRGYRSRRTPRPHRRRARPRPPRHRHRIRTAPSSGGVLTAALAITEPSTGPLGDTRVRGRPPPQGRGAPPPARAEHPPACGDSGRPESG